MMWPAVHLFARLDADERTDAALRGRRRLEQLWDRMAVRRVGTSTTAEAW